MAIYVDLDGTLAYYKNWKENGENIGDPIPLMKRRVLQWLREGTEVKIFTARADNGEQIAKVKEWLLRNGFGRLEVTNIKGMDGMEFWDDRAVSIERNTGKVIKRNME
jgi:hypothetical protein